MRTDVPEKILKIADEIAERGYANVMRLTVLKKWFKQPERLVAFAWWVAARATALKGKTSGEAGRLFAESRALLNGLDRLRPKPDRQAAAQLHDRLHGFQNEYDRQQWGPVRIIKNWNLFLIEEALAIYLANGDSPADGYRLTTHYCRHYDTRYGDSLTGPSKAKLQELVRFMNTIEALEDDLPTGVAIA